MLPFLPLPCLPCCPHCFRAAALRVLCTPPPAQPPPPGGIADPMVFARQPEVYAYGMVIALAAGFIWQGWASYAGYNVSATHSISECGPGVLPVCHHNAIGCCAYAVYPDAVHAYCHSILYIESAMHANSECPGGILVCVVRTQW